MKDKTKKGAGSLHLWTILKTQCKRVTCQYTTSVWNAADHPGFLWHCTEENI